MASEYSNLSCMSVDLKDDHTAWVTLTHPPTNLLDGDMAGELDKTLLAMEFDKRIRVIVLQSALPQFFISHSGLARVGAGPKQISATTNFRQSQVLTERLRNHPKCIIAKVEGIARGGGNEIVLGADMAFAAHGAIFGQPEIGMGLVPGGGSTQRLPALVGRARAMEILLGGDDFSAEMAAQWGWINRAMSTEELGPFVEKMARRVASWPPYTVAALKAAVNQGSQSWVPAGLLHEAHNADISVSHDITRARVKEGLELGLETADGEVHLLDLMGKLSAVPLDS